MNIFFLDRDPRLAAEYQCNKHVVKMILETAQLLCTAHRILDPNNTSLFDSENFYRATHKNHPSAIWVRSGLDQYRWTHEHLHFLLQEYYYRYGKVHATDRLVLPLLNAPFNIDYDSSWTDPPACMPDDCKVQGDIVSSYRNYYMKHKSNIAKWTKREQPSWYKV